MSKALAGLLVQVALLALAVYVGVSESAIAGSWMGRATVVVLLVVVALLVGEVTRMRQHVATLIQVIQAWRGGSVPPAERDDRVAVDVLIGALESGDAAVRQTAHKNLLRITGQGFPADASAWRKWWDLARESFPKDRGAGK